MPLRTILLFIDGFGWGTSDPQRNPQHAYGGQLLRLPELPAAGTVPVAGGGLARPLDAVLGVEGVPQSATGQTTLLTGVNAQAALGQHLTGFPNDALREILLAHSLLKQFADRGLRARFLNAFRPRFFEFPRERQLRFSATTVANLAGYLPFFTLEDVRAGRSIYQEFTNRELIERGFDLPPLTAPAAGRILARAARANDFTLYEYFQSDKAGHSRDAARCRDQLVLLDAFLAAVLAELAEDLQGGTLLVLTSDHGNLEDLSTRRHTLNPVPLMAWGAGAAAFLDGVTRLDQVAPAILARHAGDA